MARHVFTTSVESSDNLGLDPTLFTVTVGVHRLDGGLLSEEELALARAALARVAKPQAPQPTPALPPVMAEIHAIATGQPTPASGEVDKELEALAPLTADIRAIATGTKPAAE